MECAKWTQCDLVGLDVLLPHLGGVVVEHLHRHGDGLVIEARASASSATCPDCGTDFSRVHGRYQRSLTDLALAGQPVVIRLRVRRFCCQVPGSPRTTFTEQVSALTTAHARFSTPLRAALSTIAIAPWPVVPAPAWPRLWACAVAATPC